MMTRFLFPVLTALMLGGCATFPDTVGKANAPTAPPPVLVPVEDILTQADALGDGEAAIGTVEARAAALRARADRLRRQ